VTMINRWFSVRLGLALGIASAGIGVGIMAVVPAVQFMIGSLGWRTAYVALAGFVLLGLLPVGLIVLRGRPEDLGQVPDGIAPERQPEVAIRPWLCARRSSRSTRGL